MQAQMMMMAAAITATTVAMMEEAIPVVPTISLHLITIVMTTVEELGVIIVSIILTAIIMELLHLHLQAVVELLHLHLQTNYIIIYCITHNYPSKFILRLENNPDISGVDYSI
jgi:hypothetical protein